MGGAVQAVYPDCFKTTGKPKKSDPVDNLLGLLNKIAPAVKTTSMNLTGNTKCTNKKWQADFKNRVAMQNVTLTINNILTRSVALRNLYNSGNLLIEGAMYHVENGEVVFNRDKENN